MTAKLYLGTSGFSYEAWCGSFYPEGTRSDAFLAHYAAQLPAVEINHTFHQYPRESNLGTWLAETHDGFRFAVKAHRKITHRLKLRPGDDSAPAFVDACTPLGERLGPILFQLPPTMQRDEERAAAFFAELPTGRRYALEVRHPSWFETPVYDALARVGVALVRSDDGELDVPDVATAPFAYVRLRREAYAAEDLATWRTWIADVLASGRDAYVFLKHDEGGTSPLAILDALRPG